MIARCAPDAGSRRGERGGVLLLVLILGVTCTLLSMALVSTAEIGLRAETNADDLDRAERGAQSGVEWGAATIKTWGRLARSGRVVLDTGVEVGHAVRLLRSPEILGAGAANGAEATLGADLRALERDRGYAFSSFGGTNSIDHPVAMSGPAYLGAGTKPLAASTPLQMAGDLDLVTTTALTAGQVAHASGATAYGVTARAVPAWDTTPFTLGTGFTVPVTRYSGSTALTNTTLTGIVVVTLAANQQLVLQNVTIRGTLVVPWIYPPALDLLGTSTIRVRGTVAIGGGTADTGDLAILAPGSTLEGASDVTQFDVAGVSYLLALDKLQNTTFTGMVLVRNSIIDTRGPIAIARPADFLPDVPIGLDLMGGNRCAITWLGRQ